MNIPRDCVLMITNYTDDLHAFENFKMNVKLVNKEILGGFIVFDIDTISESSSIDWSWDLYWCWEYKDLQLQIQFCKYCGNFVSSHTLNSDLVDRFDLTFICQDPNHI